MWGWSSACVCRAGPGATGSWEPHAKSSRNERKSSVKAPHALSFWAPFPEPQLIVPKTKWSVHFMSCCLCVWGIRVLQCIYGDQMTASLLPWGDGDPGNGTQVTGLGSRHPQLLSPHIEFIMVSQCELLCLWFTWWFNAAQLEKGAHSVQAKELPGLTYMAQMRG